MRGSYRFEPGVPPALLQLWCVGDNPTDYGVHRWTERSAKLVFERYNERGNRLQIDIEHNARDDAERPEPSELTVTGGYAELELDPSGAPWLRFYWSLPAVEQIETRQRLYLSPEYDVDTETGEILGLARVSLVANPGTHHARILASAKEGKRMDPMLLAALEAALLSDDPKAALGSLLDSLKKGAASGPAEPVEASEPPAAPAGSPESPIVAEAPMGEEPKPKPVVASAAPAAPPPPPAPRAAVPAPSAPQHVAASGLGREAAAAYAKLEARLEAGERDRLLEREGASLSPSLRVWASSQPLATVKSFLASVEKQPEGVARVAATRGSGQGAHQSGGLVGDELAEFDRLCGVKRVAAAAPTRDPATGTLTIHNVPPSQWRKMRAATAGKAA